MGEECKGLWSYSMRLPKCSEVMHTLLKCTFLHMQVHVHGVIVPMDMEKDLKSFLKIFGNLELGL